MSLDSLNTYRENYSRLHDVTLIYIAKHESNQLEEDALIALKEEIKFRNLSRDLFAHIDIRNKIDIAEILRLCYIIQKLPCPICNLNQSVINGTITDYQFDLEEREYDIHAIRIACLDCLQKIKIIGFARVLLKVIGFWFWHPISIIHGVLKLRRKKKELREYIRNAHPNMFLVAFVEWNIGDIKINEAKREQLDLLLKKQFAYI